MIPCPSTTSHYATWHVVTLHGCVGAPCAGVRPRARALLSLRPEGPCSAGELLSACPLPQVAPRGTKRTAQQRDQEAQQVGRRMGEGRRQEGRGKACGGSGICCRDVLGK